MLGFTPLASAPLADSGLRHFIAANDIVAGVPVIDTASVFENETCNVDGITLGAPIVDSVVFTQGHNFFARNITMTPSVDSLPFTQDYTLFAKDIIAGAAISSVRFVWSLQDPVSDTWAEQEEDSKVWTLQVEGADSWTLQAENTDTWTLQAENDTTWDNAA